MPSTIVAVANNRLTRKPALQVHLYGSIRQCVRQIADCSERTNTICSEPSRFMILADGAQHSAALAVTGVEDTAQLVVVVHKRVALIDQKGRAEQLHAAENRSGRGIR